MYVYPSEASLPGGWRLRYTGIGLNHQSNGQSLPLSRSWNRVYLVAGADLDDRYIITARLWHRLSESNPTAIDVQGDDNPGIQDYIGRAEIKGVWNFDRDNQFGITLRNNLRASGRGSIRLEWQKAIGDPAHSNLRLHTQLFHGYGDSLLDYNVRRTVLMLGLSLVDF
jgi:phospholipase A1